MPKTNHQRSFKDSKDPGAIFHRGYYGGKGFLRKTMDGKIVEAHFTVGDHCRGKRGIRKDRRGAKKYVNSRARFQDRMALIAMLRYE